MVVTIGARHRLSRVGAVPEPATTDVLVTVVTACRDAAATLPAQLDALVAQQLPPSLVGGWELLICDDGSRDGSRAVAEGYRDRLPLRMVDVGPGSGSGPGAARNAGAAQARGRLLVFCDADDVVAPDWLARMVAALADHPFVAGRFDVGLNSAAALRSRTLGQQDGLQGAPGGLPHAGGGNLGIRREVFDQVGGFDPTLRRLEDTDLSWRVQQAGVPLVFAADVVVQVRLRTGAGAVFRQGRGYGAAFAELERRHPADRFGAGEPEGRRWRAWTGSPPSWAHLLWQLGWWVGHRRGDGPQTAHPSGR